MWDTDLTHSRNTPSILAIGRVVPNPPSEKAWPLEHENDITGIARRVAGYVNKDPQAFKAYRSQDYPLSHAEWSRQNQRKGVEAKHRKNAAQDWLVYQTVQGGMSVAAASTKFNISRNRVKRIIRRLNEALTGTYTEC